MFAKLAIRITDSAHVVLTYLIASDNMNNNKQVCNSDKNRRTLE